MLVWYPLRWMVEALPAGTAFGVLKKMGDLHFAVGRGKKALVVRNLGRLKERGLAAEAGERDAREYFRNHYADRLCIFIFPGFRSREIEKTIEIEGLHHLDAALAGGKGVILVHGHFGPVHVPLVVLARLGYKMKQIGLPSDDGLSWVGRKVAFRLRLKYEAMIPAEIMKADSFLRKAFKWLNSNGVIMVTGDGTGTHNRLGRHVNLPFLGSHREFPLGPTALAEKTGAALIPLFIVPGERKLYRIVIEPPLSSAQKGEAGRLDLTTQFTRRLEQYIIRHPGYMHFLDRMERGT